MVFKIFGKDVLFGYAPLFLSPRLGGVKSNNLLGRWHQMLKILAKA
ncbi:MAG: hypothetical protein Q8Q06_01390 [bacterium]|nr:hypothetical protein [bacterium]